MNKSCLSCHKSWHQASRRCFMREEIFEKKCPFSFLLLLDHERPAHSFVRIDLSCAAHPPIVFQNWSFGRRPGFYLELNFGIDAMSSFITEISRSSCWAMRPRAIAPMTKAPARFIWLPGQAMLTLWRFSWLVARLLPTSILRYYTLCSPSSLNLEPTTFLSTTANRSSNGQTLLRAAVLVYES